MTHTLRRSKSKYARTRRQHKKQRRIRGGGFLDDIVNKFKPSTPAEKCQAAKEAAREACSSNVEGDIEMTEMPLDKGLSSVSGEGLSSSSGEGLPSGSGEGLPSGSGEGLPSGSGEGLPSGSGEGLSSGSGKGLSSGSGEGLYSAAPSEESYSSRDVAAAAAGGGAKKSKKKNKKRSQSRRKKLKSRKHKK